MKKRILFIIIILLLLIPITKYFWPNDATLSNESFLSEEIHFDTTSIKTDNKASLLMNLDTNQIIYQNNINEALPVYSVSKVMFLATASERMKKDNISLDTKVKIPSYIEDIQDKAEFSNSYIKKGKSYTYEELFEAVMLPSGNDAAIFLANNLFGSHGSAVNAMNELAKEIKLKQSSFISTSGLDGKYLKEVDIKASSGKNLMSINDLIILVKYVQEHYPIIIEMANQTQTYIGSGSGRVLLNNVNTIIEGFEEGYPKVYGLKTGSNIEKYSHALVALKKDAKDQDIMAISINARTRDGMNNDVKNMYRYLKTLDKVDLKNGIEIDAQVGFAKNDVKLGMKESFILYVPKEQMFAYRLINPLNYNAQVNRFYGVTKGDSIGQLELVDTSLFFKGRVKGLSDIVVKNEVETMDFFEKVQQVSQDLLNK